MKLQVLSQERTCRMEAQLWSGSSAEFKDRLFDLVRGQTWRGRRLLERLQLIEWAERIVVKAALRAVLSACPHVAFCDDGN